MEERYQARQDEINKKFAKDDDRFTFLNEEMITEFNSCSKKFAINDDREDETQRTFKNNEIERDDLADRSTQLEKKLIELKIGLEKELAEKIDRMNNKVDVETRNLSMQVDKCNRAVDQLKIDLYETLEQKYDAINAMFDTELNMVRQRYEDIISKVRDAGLQLNESFKKKVSKIKDKSALFFSKLEMKLNDNNNEVVKISKMFRAW